MNKPFRTHDELICIMNARELKTDNRTIFILEQEGYYAVVSGYKDLFIDQMKRSPNFIPTLIGEMNRILKDLLVSPAIYRPNIVKRRWRAHLTLIRNAPETVTSTLDMHSTSSQN